MVEKNWMRSDVYADVIDYEWRHMQMSFDWDIYMQMS